MILDKTYLGNTEIEKIYLGSDVVYESIIGIQTEYQAILDEATTQGYTLPSAPDQVIQNLMVYNAKSRGLWTPSDAIYIWTGSGDENFKHINWKDPSGVKASQNSTGLVFDNTGVTGNGSAVVRTNVNMDTYTNFQRDNASLYIDVLSAPTDTTSMTMYGDASGGDYNYHREGSSIRPKLNSPSTTGFSLNTFIAPALMGIHREVTDTLAHTQDLLTDVDTGVVSEVVQLQDLTFLGANLGTTAFFKYNGKFGFAWVGSNVRGQEQDMINTFRI